ncbi:glycosyltransferase family 4 protein [Paraferrimonas haliotis]|uniref:Glycosyl transferase family 1 domain-containing protein n=1 Tax=Paraferrimonas haliotis TaxID=2013866 RepID=A0AA37WVV8_9GAMM|nr:glycosyltransferase family 4 protein [Paraferrimonas haliotis]GLS82863.1 hypothetical protein GCM10007894_08400 [Paraferrimonas haliotis]
MIAHICNNFVVSKVHYNLISKLEESFEQIVLVPYRDSKQYGIYDEGVLAGKISYLKFSNVVLKYFPLVKVFFITYLCFKELEGRKPKYLLAHTMWSDGVCAYLLSKIFGVKYTLVVRNTDINVFLPRLPHYRILMSRVLAHADSVIFVSHAHRRRFRQQYPNTYAHICRSVVIPNAISDFWLENKLINVVEKRNQVCFVGKFDQNKNIDGIYRASKLLIDDGEKFELKLLGGTHKQFLRLTGLEFIPGWVEIIPRTTDKKVIRKLYLDSKIFFMPSHAETFGLVYLEALSQGCSILATTGEGVDGYLEAKSVRFNKAIDYKGMKDDLYHFLNNYDCAYNIRIANYYLSKLSWGEVAKKYLEAMVGLHK